MDIRRLAKWLLGIGVLLWIAKNPHDAGTTVSGWVNWVIDKTEALVDAVVTFVQDIG